MERAGFPFRTSVAYHNGLNGFSLPKNYSICSSCASIMLLCLYFETSTFTHRDSLRVEEEKQLQA